MIKFLKLITGEDIISKIEEKDQSFILIWPNAIKYEYLDGESAPRSRIEPYAPHVKGHTVEINKQNVLFIADPVPPLQEYYETNILSSLPKLDEKVDEVVV